MRPCKQIGKIYQWQIGWDRMLIHSHDNFHIMDISHFGRWSVKSLLTKNAFNRTGLNPSNKHIINSIILFLSVWCTNALELACSWKLWFTDCGLRFLDRFGRISGIPQWNRHGLVNRQKKGNQSLVSNWNLTSTFCFFSQMLQSKANFNTAQLCWSYVHRSKPIDLTWPKAMIVHLGYFFFCLPVKLTKWIWNAITSCRLKPSSKQGHRLSNAEIQYLLTSTSFPFYLVQLKIRMSIMSTNLQFISLFGNHHKAGFIEEDNQTLSVFSPGKSLFDFTL